MVHTPFYSVFIFLTTVTQCVICDCSEGPTMSEGTALKFHYEKYRDSIIFLH